jgi:hypothetical protein
VRQQDGVEVTVPFVDIHEATLVVEWGVPRKP